MALRDQPYLPLYVQDFLTDEKLIECSASSTGVYIRLLCILHKSEEYGKILLKQKDKQTDKQINNFALKVAKQMPYSFEIILNGLSELLTEKVIQIDGDYLFQKRMVKDHSISLTRSLVGRKGGKSTQNKNKKFALAKKEANTENENEIVNESKSVIKKIESKVEKFNFKTALINYGFEEKLVYEWLAVRKTKRATNTETAYDGFIDELEKRQCDINEILRMVVRKSWQGFKWEWYDNEIKTIHENGLNPNTAKAINW